MRTLLVFCSETWRSIGIFNRDELEKQGAGEVVVVKSSLSTQSWLGEEVPPIFKFYHFYIYPHVYTLFGPLPTPAPNLKLELYLFSHPFWSPVNTELAFVFPGKYNMRRLGM
jgi:hypothetical protein